MPVHVFACNINISDESTNFPTQNFLTSLISKVKSIIKRILGLKVYLFQDFRVIFFFQYFAISVYTNHKKYTRKIIALFLLAIYRAIDNSE